MVTDGMKPAFRIELDLHFFRTAQIHLYLYPINGEQILVLMSSPPSSRSRIPGIS